MKIVLQAAYVAPMDRAIVRDGAVAVQDQLIAAVGTSREVCAAHQDAQVHDLGNAVLLPGLVNPHTHLELTLTECEPRGDASFTEWLNIVRKRQKDDAADAVRHGIAQSLRFGVTTIGDITQQIRITRSALTSMPVRPRVVSFGEAIGLAKRRPRFEELLAAALDTEFESPTLTIGVSPHAPYTVDRPGYETCLRMARERTLPLATHLAENTTERDFLESHAGPFRELWDQIGSWEEPVDTFHGSPIEFANAIGLLGYPSLLAHVNYCDDDALEMLARGRASVVYCPRTHRYFGHPPHRWREMLDRGINVAVGTDSCASSPDLNPVEDLRLLHEIAPEVPVELLWQMVTMRAARALCLDNQIGTIAPGKRADLVAFATTDDQPLRAILETAALPIGLWINGRAIESGPALRD